jgi:hypothetical protein
VKPPTSVRVGPFRFAIECGARQWSEIREASVSQYDAELSRAYGFTDRSACVIYLNPTASLDQQREALLHELMHAAQAVAGLPNAGTSTGEDFITRLSPILLDALDRNPRLREYLFTR